LPEGLNPDFLVSQKIVSALEQFTGVLEAMNAPRAKSNVMGRFLNLQDLKV
jgi:hypothetical protein